MDSDQMLFHRFLNMFQEVSDADFEIISQHLYLKQFNAGEVLLEQGRTAKELFFVTDGILKITSTTKKGNEVIQFFVKENKFCTILYSFREMLYLRKQLLQLLTLKCLYSQNPGWIPYTRNCLISKEW